MRCSLPERRRVRWVDLYYVRWWFMHINVFRQPSQKLKEAEEACLGRTDLPPLPLRARSLMLNFHELLGLFEIFALSGRLRMEPSP